MKASVKPRIGSGGPIGTDASTEKDLVLSFDDAFTIIILLSFWLIAVTREIVTVRNGDSDMDREYTLNGK